MVRKLRADEIEKYEKELEKEEKGIVQRLKDTDVVMEIFQNDSFGKVIVGELIHASPWEMRIILDFTGLRGSGSNIYHSFIYTVPKWAYSVKKVTDYLFVSPVYAEYHGLTLGQKQKLESAIKTGLTSAAQAVADYELIRHDVRRYEEMLDYFEEGQKDEHVLRSLFVDRVDAYTGEGYSLVTMARRWPTIITDFIRMKKEWTDPKATPESEQVDKIRKELDVSQAEATVLKTKGKLFDEWKKLFFPEIKERYARIKNLMNARKKSVDEYRNWLKPYIAKFRAMVESDERNPAQFVSNAYVTPGFGQSEALVGTRLWLYKPFEPQEKGKREAVIENEKMGFVIDPYDDVAKKWQKRIEYKYGVKFEEEDIRAFLKQKIAEPKASREFAEMNPHSLYYILFDVTIDLSLLKTPPPEGIEMDNLMIYPIRTWVISQNVMLVYLLELWAKEIAMNNYINEMIGAEEEEEEILKEVRKRFGEEEEEKPGRFQSLSKFRDRMGSGKARAKKPLMKVVRLFVRPGPYEPIFFERISKFYSRASGAYYAQLVDFLKQKMQIK